jgi:predicted kinase
VCGHESSTSHWRARLPLVLVVCGLPASGKTHLVVAVSRVAGLPRLSADVIRRELAAIEPGHLAGGKHYTAAFHTAVYDELGRRAAVHAGQAGGAIIDGSFARRTMRDAFTRAFDHAAPLVFAECTAPPEVLARRAAARSMRSRVSPATLELVSRERARWEPLDELPSDACLKVQTDRPSDDILVTLGELLDTRRC